jgi:TPR repeat protein
MSRRVDGSCRAFLIAVVAGFVVSGSHQAAVAAPLPRAQAATAQIIVDRTADTGISIVRMPRPPATVLPQPTPVVQQPPPAVSPPAPPPAPAPARPVPEPPATAPPAPRQPEPPPGRFLRLSAKLGSQPTDPQKGSIGAKMDVVDAPLATAIDLGRAGGALILEATPAGPAARAGLRFGDIVVALDGKTVASMNDFRQQISSRAPNSNIELEMWRVTADGGDFLQTLRRLAEAGNADMMVRLGRLHALGVGAPRDEAEALRWFQKGAAAGNLSAMTAYAAGLLEGRGVARDQQTGLRLLRQAADAGHVEAIYRHAVLLQEGKVVAKDTGEALRLFTRAAEGGFTPAMLDLAVMYNTGAGVRADPVMAAAWYKKAADLGNSIGMVNLGFMYQQARGVERNDIAAVALYRSAAAEGNSSGIHNLAAMLDSGNGVARKDPEQAANLILQALEMRNDFTLQQMTRNARAWTPEFRRALQRKLRDAGVYADKIDGELRASTIAAINAYADRKR